MAADAAGNDVGAVGIPLTGYLAYASDSVSPPTSLAGSAPNLALAPEDFKKVGLLKQDGGFEWTEEPTGDPIEFYQDGYSIPSGLANVTLAFTAAEHSPITRALRTGKTPDVNGYLTVDGGGHGTKYLFFSEEQYRNGRTRRRAGYGQVQTAKLQKSERGTPQGIEFVVKIVRHPAFGMEHYGEWWIDGEAPDLPPDEEG